MNAKQDEIDRIRQAYVERDQKEATNSWKTSIYHPRHPLGQLFNEHNRRIFIKALNSLNIDLEEFKILDFGCGDGYWLRMLVELGAKPEYLMGVDLSETRLNSAREKNSDIQYLHHQEDYLQLPSEAYDLVMQVVVFSSILNEDLAKLLASELYRVTKIGGYIFWLDNQKAFPPRLSGYSQEKILEYFPNTKIEFLQPLHPRYFRKFYRYSWLCQTIYQLNKIWCDALLIVLRKV